MSDAQLDTSVATVPQPRAAAHSGGPLSELLQWAWRGQMVIGTQLCPALLPCPAEHWLV